MIPSAALPDVRTRLAGRGLRARDRGPAVGVLGGLPALAPTSFFQHLSALPITLGAIPVGILAGYLFYRALRAFRAWSRGTSEPLAPTTTPPTLGGPAPKVTPAPWSEDEAPDLTPPTAPPAPAPGVKHGFESPAPGAPTSTRATLWTPERGEVVVNERWPVATIAAAPPASTGFGRRLLFAFLLVAFIALFANRYLFYLLDKVVLTVGSITYWPVPWPGLVTNPALQRTLPDYVFVIYLAFMIAFCLATGLFTNPKFDRRQRRYALYGVAAYVLTELFVDSLGFMFPGRLAGSAFLLVRGLVGGLFFALLLLNVLVLPPPIEVRPGLPRDPNATWTFVATAVVSIGLALVILYALNRFFGLGRDVVPFAILLLLPMTALTVWGFLGRGLYQYQLRARPLPSLATYHPPVTVLIPAYNEEGNIRQAIASVDASAAGYPGVTEIIVGNDGSTDRTSEIARATMRTLKHARGAVLDLPHGGKSNALNGALSVASGEVIVRIDADARISESRGFGPLVSHLADPEVGGVQGLILPLQPEQWTGKLRLMEIAWNHLFLRRAQMATRTTQVVDGAFCAFRKSDLDRVGGWVAWNGEDTEITLRLQRIGYRMRLELGGAAFEDVPATYASLRKQRIRWNRGGLFAHRRHVGALFGEAFEFGGLSILLWFTLFARNGLRGLVWAYAAFLTILIGLPTILNVLLIAALLLIPRGIVIGFYLVRFGRWRYLPYILTWPVTGGMKQFFSLEAFGTMLPGSLAEFSE